MVNKNNSIVTALFARATSLDERLNSLTQVILENDPADDSFTRLRLEVVIRQRNDAWDAYWSASSRMGVREQTFVQDDLHVLDYIITRMQ